jgi:hypothetical protein
MFFVIVIHIHVVFIQHNSFGNSIIHTFQLDKISIQKIHLFAISSKKFIDVQFSSKKFIHFLLSSMYMWKNIFHIIPTLHRDNFKIICLRHQNIPNIFVLACRLLLTSSYSSSHVRFLISLMGDYALVNVHVVGGHVGITVLPTFSQVSY